MTAPEPISRRARSILPKRIQSGTVTTFRRTPALRSLSIRLGFCSGLGICVFYHLMHNLGLIVYFF